jgi:hypothetical protein
MWVRSNLANGGFAHCVGLLIGLRWSLLSGLVGPVLVVVPLVFSEDLSGVCLVEDQNVVADLVAEGPDDSFAVCV